MSVDAVPRDHLGSEHHEGDGGGGDGRGRAAEVAAPDGPDNPDDAFGDDRDGEHQVLRAAEEGEADQGAQCQPTAE